jgi:UDP-N-acetylmuramoyl-L-alanyl-D-glutamate--2,6-diaminopimelate ligase
MSAGRVAGGGAVAVSSVAVSPFLVPRPFPDLLVDLLRREVRGDPDVPISDLSYRSPDAAPGSLFFCVPGATLDGHDFAEEAVSKGAVALAVERWLPVEATQVLVPSVREAMGPVSAAFYDRPAQGMTMVGVTGTNGKTTTTYVLESVFRAADLVPGVVGTTGVRIGGRPAPALRTTPEAPDLQRLLAEMRDEGVGAVAMEVSSHGLDQHRVGGIRFTCAVFTNLTQDHLDYHASMEAYFAAKARLFTRERSERAVVNIDDPAGRRLRDLDLPTITFGIENEGAEVRATDVRATDEGIAFRVDDIEIRSPLRGRFNVENCLAAIATARALGIEDSVAVRGIEALRGVPGRVEPVDVGQDFLVMVDYAHTPASLESVLLAARSLTAGRVIVVFGCGGDRDRAKRPFMGRVAAANADLTVITSDNPRSEDPGSIIREIESGASGGGAYVIEPDRRTAIHTAVAEARTDDIVVIAGKGHETYQELADRTIAFDDRAVASEEIRALRGTG